jgi:hypothetical protein
MYIVSNGFLWERSKVCKILNICTQRGFTAFFVFQSYCNKPNEQNGRVQYRTVHYNIFFPPVQCIFLYIYSLIIITVLKNVKISNFFILDNMQSARIQQLDHIWLHCLDLTLRYYMYSSLNVSSHGCLTKLGRSSALGNNFTAADTRVAHQAGTEPGPLQQARALTIEPRCFKKLLVFTEVITSL